MFVILMDKMAQDDVAERFHLEAEAEQAGQSSYMAVENRLKWQRAME